MGSEMCIRDRFKEGYSLEHVMQVRQLEHDAALEHMVLAAENNFAVDSDWLLDTETQQRLSSFVEEHEGKRLPQMLASIPDGIDANELLLFLKCQDSATIPVQ